MVFPRLRFAAWVALPSALLTLGCAARFDVVELQNRPHNKVDLQGVPYALPRTVLVLEQPIRRFGYKPGEYWEFRDLFVPGKSKFENETDRDKVAKSLRFKLMTPGLTAVGEPDPDQVFLLKVKGKGAVKQVADFQLAESGAVTGLASEVDNQTSDLVLALVSAAAGVSSRTALGGGRGTNCDQERGFDCFIDTHGLRANFDHLSTARQEELRRIFEDEDQKVRLLAAGSAFKERIVDFSRATEDLAIGPAAEFIYTQRQRILAENIASLFTETENETQWSALFHLRPAALAYSDLESGKNPDPITLFLFSTVLGICGLEEPLAGLPPPEGFLVPCPPSESSPVRVSFTLDPGNQYAQIFSRNFFQPKEDGFNSTGTGFRFRVPARVRINVSYEKGASQTLLQSYALVAQFGAIGALPAEFGGKALAYDLAFYDASGALKSLKLASQPMITKGVVDSLSASTTQLLEARSKQLEAAREAADELNQLERRRKLLEEKKKILDLCAQLGIPESECNVK
jgi:hypothetical protein